MKAGWVGWTEFNSQRCFEEFAVSLIRVRRAVIRETTEVNFFSPVYHQSYMIRGAITASAPQVDYPFLLVMREGNWRETFFSVLLEMS